MPILKSSNKINYLNTVFVVEVILFGLIITGILPRSVVPYFSVALVLYIIFASLEDTTIFFVRSIPFFLAIPITATFDNFNSWRILAGIIFLKWMIKSHNLNPKSIYIMIRSYQGVNMFKKISLPLVSLLLLSALSIIPATDKILAVKRIIYFLNLSLVGLVIYDLAQKQDFAKRLIKNISIPVIAVTLIGFIQLISTYFIDIYQFMRIWGEGIQCNQFGNQWCDIAVQVGNTWFAYYGEQLSLRVFSLFPDSHSFPQFILLGLPSVFVIALSKVVKEHHSSFKKMIKTRSRLIVIAIPLIFLASILTGTRGIWAGSIGALMAGGFYVYILKKNNHQTQKGVLIYLTSYISIFFLLLAVAFPIFESPQFLLSKGDSLLFGRRIRSIIDFGETSNSQRIAIWKSSLVSIKNHPMLGVGIGNFPVVLNQKLELARAGSSAHNIYLQIASEMGIPALIFSLWFLWLLMQGVYNNFVYSKDWEIMVYNGSALIFIPWILVYCLTDVALFDERAFLLFITIVSIILANKNPLKSGRE
ncbi:MAG TPA: O-antigen ligase family protein [Candidatus Paceibacterota bacterium]